MFIKLTIKLEFDTKTHKKMCLLRSKIKGVLR